MPKGTNRRQSQTHQTARAQGEDSASEIDAELEGSAGAADQQSTSAPTQALHGQQAALIGDQSALATGGSAAATEQQTPHPISSTDRHFSLLHNQSAGQEQAASVHPSHQPGPNASEAASAALNSIAQQIQQAHILQQQAAQRHLEQQIYQAQLLQQQGGPDGPQQHLQRKLAQAGATSAPINVDAPIVRAGHQLVEMSAQQYAAFLQYQQQQQQSVPVNASSAGGASAIPSASYSGGPPAFKSNLRDGSRDQPVDVVTLHSSSSSSREREDTRPPPKKPKEKSPLSGAGEGGQIKHSKSASRPKTQEKAPEMKSPNRLQQPPVDALWRCPTCGSLDTKHDVLNCSLPKRTDLSPSLSQFEINFLVTLDQMRRKMRRMQGLTAPGNDDEEAADEEESIGSRSKASHSESEEENEEDREFIRDSEESYRSSLSSSAAAQSSASNSASNSAPRNPSQPGWTAEARLNKMENVLMLLSEKVLRPAGLPASESTGGLDLSSWQTPQGMVGIPEMKRVDLLKLPEFEALEKKYTDYCDKAQTHRRQPQPIAQCFGKFLPDIKLSINSLLSRDEAVRKKFKKLLARHDYKVTEQILNDMSTQDFSNLYRELVTTRSFMASELLSYLMETPFQRTSAEGQEKITLTLAVLQASTAFRERLESCATNTVKKCTPVQFRDAFVKMVLGNDERNLADFLHCDTWDEAAQAMMDLEGTGQGVTFMKKVQKKSPKNPEESDRSSAPSQQRRDQDHKPRKESADGTDWEKTYKELSATIEANETEMRGHTHSYRERVKRLLSLRDARNREALLVSMEKGGGSALRHSSTETHRGGGSSAAPYQPRNDQRHDQRHRSHSPRHYQDHRDYEQAGAPPYNRGQQYDHSRGGGQWDHHHLQPRRDPPRDAPPRERDQSPRPYQREQSPRPADMREQDQGGARQTPTYPPSKSQVAPTEGTQRRCFNCGGDDHLARECPKIGGDGGSARRQRAANSRSPSRP